MKQNEKFSKKDMRLAQEIKSLQEGFSSLSDEQLKAKFADVKLQYSNGKISEEKLLPIVYAIVCETAKRTTNMNPYLVQVMGAISLNNGNVASMATGEGKTLSSTMPAVLNTITHKCVHIATANEYLAKRDAEEMSAIYNFLGLSVGVVYSDQPINEKRKAYSCDITYGTGSEFGFDYLRDKIAMSKKELSGQRFGFAIVDEVDSILIDDATNPLIISQQTQTDENIYKQADAFVRSLDENDFIYDPKTKQIHLDETGYNKAEKVFNIDFVSGKNFDMVFYINNALKAHYVLRNNVDYKVDNDKIVLIDSNTGRVMQGREYSGELNQALQAKENVTILPPTLVKAQTTYPNYFSKYQKISGMTGTALEAESEFKKYYNMLVDSIPTNKPRARVDEGMKVYIDKKSQLNAILAEVKKAQITGQPLLIGTITIEQSEEIAKILRANNFSCNVLNANTTHEAEIISQAGKKGQITICTNVAGRGTDIKLGGDAKKLTISALAKQNITLTQEEQNIVFANQFNSTDENLQLARQTYLSLQKQCKEEKSYVNSIGGLRVISTTLSENQRAKDQLIGRSGRQGDNGSSVVIVSIDDEILTRYYADEHDSLKSELFSDADSNGLIKDKKLEKILTRAEQLTSYVAKDNRSMNIKFDNILESIRKQVYKERDVLLSSNRLTDYIEANTRYCVEKIINKYDDVNEINRRLKNKFGKLSPIIPYVCDDKEKMIDKITARLMQNRMLVLDTINTSEQNRPFLNNLLKGEKQALINGLDSSWSKLLSKVDEIKQDCFLKAYSQTDPYQEFAISSKDEFKSIMHKAKLASVEEIFNSLNQVATNLKLFAENQDELEH